MHWLKNLAAAAFGLFVDDGWLAAACLVWLLVVWQGLPRLHVPAAVRGVALFAGLVVILTGSVLQRARRHARGHG